MRDFNLDEELREIITSAIDLNKAQCTHEEIVTDIAPCIKRIYEQAEAEGYKKGLKAAIEAIEMRERMLRQLSEPSSLRFLEIKEISKIVSNLVEKKYMGVLS